jgi:diaminopimelate decarboxylase
MGRLNAFNSIDSETISTSAKQNGTPLYLYDEQVIVDKCRSLLAMPNAYGLTVRYAMKANSNRSLLKIINAQGLKIDASSMNEVRRAYIAGIPYEDIMLTTQEAPVGEEMDALKEMMRGGLKYNVCSLQQLRNIGDFAAENKIRLAMRVHPGVGSGESATRNTGDKYSCFGVHLSDLNQALEYAKGKRLIFDCVHAHIGSGGDPAIWQSNIDTELTIIERHFPDAQIVSFGGGLKEARMPDEKSADIEGLGGYAKEKIEQFYQKTNRKLKMEIEPGTYVIALAGFVVTRVIDKKNTGGDGFNFLILDGGMEVNTRPLLYAARHPFYVVSQAGALHSSEFDEKPGSAYQAVLVGRCCESGDSQCLDGSGLVVPRKMSEPEINDFIAIGGAGAYCSAMALSNYNSHVQAPELLYACDHILKVIRSKQTLQQILANEA